jgi:hypothetical protein
MIMNLIQAEDVGKLIQLLAKLGVISRKLEIKLYTRLNDRWRVH